MEATSYKLNEAKHNERLAEFRESSTLDSLADEIALCRTILESATNDSGGKPLPLIRDLLSTLATLVKTHRQKQIEDGHLMAKPIILAIGRDMGKVIAEELQALGDGWEQIADRISIRLAEVIEQASKGGKQ